MTSQKMLMDSCDMAAVSFVPTYSQIMANTDTSGMEANMALNSACRLPSSETMTIRTAEISTLMR